MFGLISSRFQKLGHLGADVGPFGAPSAACLSKWTQDGKQDAPRRPQDGIWGHLKPMWGRSWGPRWGPPSAIHRRKRALEGPNPRRGSDLGATLHQRHELIDV